ncbi:PTS transporter subunit EIIB, partial [Vagococcus salmoninarum]
MNYQELVEMILTNVGGPGNLKSYTHCATRLRFQLKDSELVNQGALEEQQEVISIIESPGQLQIVIGTHVNKVYEALVAVLEGKSESNVIKEKLTILSGLNAIFSTIAGIFTPLLPALAGSGILRGLLTLAEQAGLISVESGTYGILSAASLAVFYFLPIELAFTSALKFKTNPYIAVLFGGALMHP